MTTLRCRQMLRHLLIAGGLLLSPLVLTACHTASPAQPQPEFKDSMRIPHEVIASWEEHLAIDNIQLDQQGWQLRIMIPADNVFVVGSTKLTPPAARTFAEIAHYLRLYVANTDKPYPIEIVGHTDITHTHAGGLRVSKGYAQILASFLWHHGVPVDRMKVSGVGSTQPIADSTTTRGMAENRRIEVLVH